MFTCKKQVQGKAGLSEIRIQADYRSVQKAYAIKELFWHHFKKSYVLLQNFI